MARSKKLPNKTATGNVELQGPEDSVYALLGYNTFPYRQKTQDDYKLFLRELNLADLHRHAVEHDVIPSAVSRAILEDRLLTKFLKMKFAYIDKRDAHPVTAKLADKDEQDIANLLARAR